MPAAASVAAASAAARAPAATSGPAGCHGWSSLRCRGRRQCAQQGCLGGQVGGDLGGAGAEPAEVSLAHQVRIWLISAGRTAGGGRSPALLLGCRLLVAAVIAGEGVVADAVTAGGFVVLGGDDAQVVDAGPGRRRGGSLRSGLGMGVQADALRAPQAPGLPFQRTSTTARSNGSKTHSTQQQASTGSVSYTPPNSLIVAVLATVRGWDHKNASRSCSGDGVGNESRPATAGSAAARSPRAAGHGKPSRTRR